MLILVAIAMITVGALSGPLHSMGMTDVLGGCKSQEYMPYLNIIGGVIIILGTSIRELIQYCLSGIDNI